MGIVYDPKNDEVNIQTIALENFIKKLEKDYEFMSKNTIISFEDYSFKAPSDQAKVLLDRNMFSDKKHLIELATNKPVKIKVSLDTWDDSEKQLAKTQEIITKITKPLLIKYGRNPIYIPTEKLSDFVDVEQIDNIYTGFIKYDPISAYIKELDQKHANPDIVVMHNEAVEAIRQALLFRATDYQVNNAVILPLEGKAKTDGSLHDTYLEVIKSQQRLYRFEKGKLTKTYIISTGLTLETPAGNYSILGRDRMAISYTGGWYMPTYLPIGYINGSLRFGFHAIPYHMDGAGNIYSRDPNTMGSPATGGCIQLNSDDALELFEWAWVGMPVYVYE